MITAVFVDRRVEIYRDYFEIFEMPEGHTIHRLAKDHQKWFAGQKMGALSPQGRFSKEARRISGLRLNSTSAHGKHLFYHWEDGQTMHIHLGLYGKFRVHRNPAPEPRGAVRVRMIGNERTFDLNGPNCCELLTPERMESLSNRLGQDPLRSDASPEIVWDRFTRSRSCIGTLLLNQSVIAGVGNVYRAEILFLLGIHPETPVNTIDRQTFDQLWDLTSALLKTGVRYNRIITAEREKAGKPLSRLNTRERLHIYKRSHCPVCNQRIRTWELGNRKMYACEKCQKLNS